jgi:hypothetical protein
MLVSRLFKMPIRQKLKVVLIGAGSASFGRGTIVDLMASEEWNQPFSLGA